MRNEELKEFTDELYVQINAITYRGYYPFDTEVLEVIFEEAKGSKKMPIKRRYLDHLEPEYNKYRQPTGQYAVALQAQEKQFKEDIKKHSSGIYDYDEKYTYYDIPALPSMKVLAEIDKHLIKILEYRKNKDFDRDWFFNRVQSLLEKLDPRIAKDRIEHISENEALLEKRIEEYENELIVCTDQNQRQEIKESIEDMKDEILIITYLMGFLEKNYKGQTITAIVEEPIEAEETPKDISTISETISTDEEDMEAPIEEASSPIKMNINDLDKYIKKQYIEKSPQLLIRLKENLKLIINTNKSTPKTFPKKYITAVADAIWESGIINPNHPEIGGHFKNWHKRFYDMLDEKESKYRASSEAVMNIRDEVRNEYSYLRFT